MKAPLSSHNEPGRQHGIDHAGKVIKACCSIAALGLVLSPRPTQAFQGQASVLLTNGNVQLSYTGGNPGQYYVVEWTGSLAPPVTWTPMTTNNTDVTGLAVFTDTPTVSPKFYRVRPESPLPLVYALENTGSACAAPPLPGLGSLPLVAPLPDPFLPVNAYMSSNWSARTTNFSDWKCRRAEIAAQIQNYEIGTKPTVALSNMFANYSGGTLSVWVTNNNHVLALTCPVILPAGSGPFPVVIGMDSPYGSIPSSLFTSRNIASIKFSNIQVTVDDNPQTTDPYYVLYGPTLNPTSTGQYSAWSWGVSRIIDALEMVSNTLPIDIKHIAVTGCSYAGKMALFAGAFDERVALTLAQESGGGGATSWRYSATEPVGSVEGLAQTDSNWFEDAMFQFAGPNVSYLPEDHHELMAMCAPRALLVTGNTNYLWLSNPSCYICSRACQQIYNTLGISDRFGFFIDSGHSHCDVPTSQYSAIGAFLDKFLLGITNANTAVATYPSTYSTIDYARWYNTWGSSPGNFDITLTFEPECATVGTNWLVLTDTDASNGKYVVPQPGVQSLSTPPSNSWDYVTIAMGRLNYAGTYNLFARLNCPSTNNDSLWIKVDSGSWTMVDGLVTSGWQWMSLTNYTLTASLHTFTIGYRQDGVQVDKVSFSTSPYAPQGLGQAAVKLCP